MTASMAAWIALLALPTLGALVVIDGSPSRRLLAISIACAIPVLGPIIAIISIKTRGSDKRLGELERVVVPPRQPGAHDVRRLAELPAVIDRLLSIDAPTRIAAITAVSHRADEQAVRALRWTIEHGNPDAVLDAALTLEELDLRRERARADTAKAAAAAPSYESEFAAGRAAADGVLTGLADPAVIPALARTARAHYHRAVSLAPSRRPQVDRALAELELAAGRAAIALPLITRLQADECGDDPVDELRALYLRALFGARRRSVLAFERNLYAQDYAQDAHDAATMEPHVGRHGRPRLSSNASETTDTAASLVPVVGKDIALLDSI